MARPTIVYDASGGSDTGASGAGPTTPATGVNADISGTTITFNETVDLSGSGAGGADLDAIWYDGNAGDRHLFRITAYTGSQAAATAVTVAETATAVRTGSNWAVGGARQTLDNDTTNTDIADGGAGWIFELETGSYASAVTLTTTAGDVTDGPIIIRGASGADHPSITPSAQVHTFTIGGGALIELKNITIGTWANRNCISCTGAQTFDIDNVIFDVTTSNSRGIDVNQPYGTIHNCRFDGSDTGVAGVNVATGGRVFLNIVNCVFVDWTGGTPINFASTGALSMATIINNLIYGGASNGISIASAGFDTVTIIGNTIDGATSDGISISNIAEEHHIFIENNIFSNNGAYGIDAPSGADFTVSNDYNAFFDNTSGNTNNLTVGANSVELVGTTPYNAGATVFTLNDTAGAGADLRAAGFPGAMADGANVGYRDIGALQHEDTGGGGGGAILPVIRRHGT